MPPSPRLLTELCSSTSACMPRKSKNMPSALHSLQKGESIRGASGGGDGGGDGDGGSGDGDGGGGDGGGDGEVVFMNLSRGSLNGPPCTCAALTSLCMTTSLSVMMKSSRHALQKLVSSSLSSSKTTAVASEVEAAEAAEAAEETEEAETEMAADSFDEGWRGTLAMQAVGPVPSLGASPSVPT